MSTTPQDQRHYEPPNLPALQSEFPDWHFWMGVNDRLYARLPKTSPPIVRSAIDPQSLRDQIIAYVWKVNR